MSQFELKYQKELVASAKQQDCLAAITTDRFKKGRPDIIIKARDYPALYLECKYETIRKTTNLIPIEATELQRHCLKHMRDFGMWVCLSIKVQIDKKEWRVYNIFDLNDTHFNYNQYPYYSSLGSEKGKLKWPIKSMLIDTQAEHRTL